ncbi:hypothetical protein ONZ45_g5862 [Pleurotus djamor]|nr:hypothetical protein ONZ45_g5862 [Pleurotus djamor]
MSQLSGIGNGRIVPGFLVQTGDRTGTGGGGESFYGEPFEDEIHPRLRFAHRGIVAMANSGSKNTNDSQFFITLDKADELHGKHTLFGRVIGDTIFNVMKIGEMEIGENERPVYPPKIKTIRIIDNPFDDIVPRITAAEKRAQQRAREDAQREREEAERRKGAKKNTKLLSFGGDEDADEEEEPVTFKKKQIARPDLIENPDVPTKLPDFVSEPARHNKSSRPKEKEPEAKPSKPEKSRKTDDDITKIREKHAQEQAASENSRKAEIEKMELEIRKLTKRRDGDDSDEERAKKKPKKSYLEEEMAKYSKNRGIQKKGKDGRKKDESNVLAALSSFRTKLQSTMLVDDEPADERPTEEGESAEAKGPEEEGLEVDDDRGFMGHALHFPKDDGEESRKAERDYEVIDPRQRALLLLVHLYILDYPHANRAEYDHEIFNPATRGLRDRVKTMEDVTHFLVSTIVGKKESRIPAESTAFRVSLTKYLEGLRTRHRETSKDEETSILMSSMWKDTLVRKSLLEECAGDRFEQLILSLSTHAIYHCLRKSTKSLNLLDNDPSLLRSEPPKYALLLARSQAQRKHWKRLATLLAQRQSELHILQRRLSGPNSTRPQSTYGNLPLEKAHALAQSKYLDLIQAYGVEEALPSPLQISAAYHPSYLRKLKQHPLHFAAPNVDTTHAEETTRLLMSGKAADELSTEAKRNRVLAAALQSSRRVNEQLSAKLQALRSAPTIPAKLDINNFLRPSLLNCQDIPSIDVDFETEFTPALVESLSLQISDPSSGELASRIDHIRRRLLPNFPEIPSEPVKSASSTYGSLHRQTQPNDELGTVPGEAAKPFPSQIPQPALKARKSIRMSLMQSPRRKASWHTRKASALALIDDIVDTVQDDSVSFDEDNPPDFSVLTPSRNVTPWNSVEFNKIRWKNSVRDGNGHCEEDASEGFVCVSVIRATFTVHFVRFK